MPRCKAPEVLRNEAYLDVRRNDEGREKRSRWAFFSSLSRVEVAGDPAAILDLMEKGLFLIAFRKGVPASGVEVTS